MATFRLCYKDWVRQHDAQGPFFDVYAKEEELRIRCVHVLLGWHDIQALKYEMRLQEPEGDAQFESAVIRYAIQRIEQELREDIFPNPPGNTTDYLYITHDKFPMLRQMLQEKTCSYQIKEGRDLLCSAASEADKTLRGKIGFRFIAPTSRSICRACSMPDTDYLCSHFLHPEVLGQSDRGIRLQRGLVKGLCDIGRDEVQQPHLCYAGGSQCWEWLIEPIKEQIIIPSSPLALPEALDFLDTAWRLAFDKQALLRLRDTTSSAKLSQACTTRADFESHLSALDDILKTMDIPDALLAKPENIKKDQTFLRLLDCLRSRLDDNDYQEVRRAVSTLQSVNKVRVSLQHSGAFRELHTHLAKLGIPSPPDWSNAWDHIRAATIDALRVIREKVQRFAA
jgi:hypothetical protein